MLIEPEAYGVSDHIHGVTIVIQSRVGMQSAIVSYRFCPSVRHVVVLHLKE